MKAFEVIGTFNTDVSQLMSVVGTGLVGKLSFDYERGIVLEIFDDTRPIDIKRQTADLMWGITADGDLVTLIECKNMYWSHPSTGLTTTKYLCTYAFKGKIFLNSNDENLRFSEVQVTYNYLHDWMQWTAFRYDFEEFPHRHTLNAVLPSPVHITIEDVRISLTLGIGFASENKRASFHEDTYVEFEAQTSKSISDWMGNYVSRFQDFLSIALGQAVPIFDVTVSPDDNSVIHSENTQSLIAKDIPLKLFYVPPYKPVPEATSRINPQSKIFMFSDLRDLSLQEVLTKWFSEFGTGRSRIPRQLFLNTWYRPDTFLETRFLNLAQALEVFHRNYYNTPPLSNSEYNQRKDAIIAKIEDDSELQQWYKMTQPRNDQTFLDRLKYLYEITFATTSRYYKDGETFGRTIKNTRNYYTHYSEHSEKDALTGLELYKLCECISFVLIHLFLLRLGFSSEHIAELFSENYNYLHL